jgi:hypothetical protein
MNQLHFNIWTSGSGTPPPARGRTRARLASTRATQLPCPQGSRAEPNRRGAHRARRLRHTRSRRRSHVAAKRGNEPQQTSPAEKLRIAGSRRSHCAVTFAARYVLTAVSAGPTTETGNRDRQPRPATETGNRDRQPRPATETGNRDRQPRPTTDSRDRKPSPSPVANPVPAFSSRVAIYAPYPFGFCFAHRHESAHISLSPSSAFHPSSEAARAAFA